MADLLTDFLYVVQDHIVFDWSNILRFVTVFVGRYMFVFLEGLIDELKRGATA